MAKTLNQIFAQFLRAVDVDIKSLQQYPNADRIIERLCDMSEDVKSSLAILYSSDKKNDYVSNSEMTGRWCRLNLAVNDAYNWIVEERFTYLEANNLKEEDIDAYITEEAFLSYCLFLDAFTSLGLYYVIAIHFPYHFLLHFQNEKQQRDASKHIKDKE